MLERAELQEDACEILLEGADRGTPKEEPLPPDPISYAWSLPRAKAIQPEVLIAYQMNGRDLSRDHGFPVRAIVPGHYGMASVKWLTGIWAAREPFHGYWQTSDYAYWASMDGKPVRRPLGEMQLKSEIARPRVYETLVPNRIYTVSGAAWAGETDVTEIAVSTDQRAFELCEQREPFLGNSMLSFSKPARQRDGISRRYAGAPKRFAGFDSVAAAQDQRPRALTPPEQGATAHVALGPARDRVVPGDNDRLHIQPGVRLVECRKQQLSDRILLWPCHHRGSAKQSEYGGDDGPDDEPHDCPLTVAVWTDGEPQ
jgi:Oxidoreductase molybdopterin binding domain